MAPGGRGQQVWARAVTEDSVTAGLGCYDTATQRITTQVVTLDQQGIQLRPVALRYCWPAELDLMAGQAGLRLRERYGDWDRRPFGSASETSTSRRTSGTDQAGPGRGCVG